MKTVSVLLALLAGIFLLQSCEDYDEIDDYKVIQNDINNFMNAESTVKNERTYENLLNFITSKGLSLTKEVTNETQSTERSGGDKPYCNRAYFYDLDGSYMVVSECRFYDAAIGMYENCLVNTYYRANGSEIGYNEWCWNEPPSIQQ